MFLKWYAVYLTKCKEKYDYSVTFCVISFATPACLSVILNLCLQQINIVVIAVCKVTKTFGKYV